jgi:hypothetical protein
MFPSSNLYAKENLYSLICTLLRLKWRRKNELEIHVKWWAALKHMSKLLVAALGTVFSVFTYW